MLYIQPQTRFYWWSQHKWQDSGLLFAKHPINMFVYLRDRPIQTTIHAATLTDLPTPKCFCQYSTQPRSIFSDSWPSFFCGSITNQSKQKHSLIQRQFSYHLSCTQSVWTNIFNYMHVLQQPCSNYCATKSRSGQGQHARVLYSSDTGCLTWFIHECMLWNWPLPLSFTEESRTP